MATPLAPNHAGITVEDIRHIIFDRSPADNQIDMDLSWTDPEIMQAMRFCAMSYNAITPYVDRRLATTLPNEMTFIHGTIYHLYLSRHAQLIRSDLDYTAGNMTADRVKRFIAHLEKGMEMHKAEFDARAKERKLFINLNAAYRQVG